MKPENLETLLLERALGQLAPEVADLLATHLASDPAAAQRAAAFAATVALARAAVAAPPADAAAWRRVRRAGRWRAARVEAMKLAAGVAVGFGLALAWHVRGPAPAPERATNARAPAIEAQSTPAFWSTARLVAGARPDTERGAEESNRYQPHWLSPVKRPHAEDRQ